MIFELEGQLSFFDDVPETVKRDDLLDRALLRGSGFSGGKKRIYSELSKDITINEKASFLKDEYGTGGMNPIFDNYDLHYDPRGIILENRFTNERYAMDYSEAVRRTERMIRDGTYTYEEEEEEDEDDDIMA